MRLPVLWERTAPEGGAASWSFSDERLARLRELGIRPIIGLVHHGSGPPHTSLLEDSFVSGLASFARLVAERYPWVTDYTPVNEPLTTARFSALYGHWYPHARDAASFLRALLVQCRATRAAMRAIRQVVPGARLVQTEDLGTIHSTRELEYQARFENERRFLSLDLLSGTIGAEHPIFGWLVGSGLGERDLADFATEPCPPDIIGLNHYVTSDRFLDHRIADYPPHVRGGNGIAEYADVEAVRTREAGFTGHGALLVLLWKRYRIPLAITEAHLGCAPEEQIRFLGEAWDGAKHARARGADVRAVTVWSIFGACDWDSLLTNPRGHYEPGAFDVRGDVIRPTAIADVARDLATRGESRHPLLATAGWWRRDDRLLYGAAAPRATPRASPPILITGAAGTLGRAIERICDRRRIHVVPLCRRELDITDRRAVSAALDHHRPWAVVNASGFVRVDEAETARLRCFQTNVDAAVVLAEACAARRIRHVMFSSDLVFDGTKSAAYVERDAAAPLNAYGESKAIAERAVREVYPDAIVVRTSAFFGPWDTSNFVHVALAELAAGRTFRAADDLLVSPTYVPDLADAVVTLLVDGATGLWHLASRGAVTWADLARRAAEGVHVSTATLVACPHRQLELRARRPRNSVLASERGALLRSLDEVLSIFAEEWSRHPEPRGAAEG
ncbi:MAG TPA: sugar nucleotide-binding protein [Labilithrix sp.]|nr:sugar nucleotide-binding protein [Labilithrix sp.]